MATGEPVGRACVPVAADRVLLLAVTESWCRDDAGPGSATEPTSSA